MINKILTSGLCGASLIAAFLLFNGFNPAHNKSWLLGAGLITATSTAIAELTNQKNQKTQLKQLLIKHLKQLPAGSQERLCNVALLLALTEHKNLGKKH